MPPGSSEPGGIGVWHLGFQQNCCAVLIVLF